MQKNASRLSSFRFKGGTGKTAIVPLIIIFFCAFRTGAAGWSTGLPAGLIVTPAIVDQGEDATSTIKAQVSLRTPSPCYFICEVRSADREQLLFKDIIFKKGDTVGSGTGTIDWSQVSGPVTLEVSAFSIDAPDKAVTVEVTLHPKDDGASSPGNGQS